MNRAARHLLLGVLLSAACTNADDGGGGSIEFAAELPLLPDFEMDSGYLPDAQPVQVRVLARAGGAITAAAEATSDGTALTAVSGSGALGVSAAFTFEVYAKVDVTGVPKFDELVKSIEYALPAGSASFEPFLLDGEVATVTTSLSPGELAALPLGALPATLVLSIEGGALATTFSGTCAAARDGLAQFTGSFSTTGQVQLGALVRIEVPLVGTQEYGPFTIPVDIPAIEVAMDLGTLDSSGGAVEGPGPCADPDGDGVPNDDGDGDGDGDGDPDPDPAVNCGLPLNLGDLGVETFGSATGGFFGGSVSLDHDLDDAATPSILNILVMEGYGAFRDGLAPGVYQIAGDDTDYSLCGDCITIATDLDAEGLPRAVLVAERGTVTLAEVDPTPGTGRLAGTITNVDLRQIEVEDGLLVEVDDGCETRVESFSFDVWVAAPE